MQPNYKNESEKALQSCAHCQCRNSKSCPKAELQYKSPNAKRRSWVTVCERSIECSQFAQAQHHIEIRILIMGEVNRTIYPADMDEARESYYQNYEIASQYTQLIVDGEALNTAKAHRYLKGRLHKHGLVF